MTNGHARFPLPNPLPQAGEGANESLRASHITPPLRGLKIAVTRPRDQAAPLTDSLTQAGGIPLAFPLLEIEPSPADACLQEQLSRVAQADLAIFISPNAVRYGHAAMRAAGFTFPPSTTIAAVGQGSAKALRELGYTDILVPTERFDSEGLLALPELNDVAGRRVMIFRGNGGRELLGDTLKSRGAAVEYVECYRRSRPQYDIAELLAASPDAITVTSSEALDYLRQMLEDDGGKDWRDLALFAPHPRIAELARRQGWLRVVETASGDDGLMAGLVAWAGNRNEC
jgi:uroporphyrinogen-III synthase